MSDNKQENEKRATIADIVAEMRRREKSHYYPKVARNIMHQYADRIEAAWKRETSQSWHHREMEELVLRHEKDVAELKKQIGNAAATREALEKVAVSSEYALKHDDLDCGDLRGFIEEMGQDARAALSAPARNCDRYKNKKDAEAAFISEECKHPCGNCTVDNKYGCALVHECGVDWLFATAERKGERDGR